MNVEALDIRIIGPAMIAGLLVIATHVPLGREVLRRGIIFIDLAVAQTAGLGVILASTLGWHVHGVGAQLAAVAAALGAALLLTWTERRYPDVQEAIIGVLFILAATGGILLLANNPRAGEALQDLLVGQILWVDIHNLGPATIVTIAVLGLWFSRVKLGSMGFYVLFAVSVTASVQLVGIYLVFASLIIPALATRESPLRDGLILAYMLGIGGYLLGLVLSAVLDLPTGAVIVWSLAILAVIMEIIRSFVPLSENSRR